MWIVNSRVTSRSSEPIWKSASVDSSSPGRTFHAVTNWRARINCCDAVSTCWGHVSRSAAQLWRIRGRKRLTPERGWLTWRCRSTQFLAPWWRPAAALRLVGSAGRLYTRAESLRWLNFDESDPTQPNWFCGPSNVHDHGAVLHEHMSGVERLWRSETCSRRSR